VLGAVEKATAVAATEAAQDQRTDPKD